MNALPAPVACVGDARWLSLHLFGGDRDAVLLDVVRPALAQLAGAVDRFFFIRYPEGGDHLRVRLRVAAGHEPAPVLARAAALLRAPMLEVVPARLELELERYGGARHFPSALAFFALSSADALALVARWRGTPRSRQLIEILAYLAGEAAAMASSAAELRALADYAAQWRPRMAPAVARAAAMFAARGPALVQRVREVIAAAPVRSLAARALSAALADLDREARWRALGSQLHMASNRLGLANAEESYLSAILCHALDALADELPALVHAVAGAPDAAATLDALAGAATAALQGAP